MLIVRSGVSKSARFSPALQDQFADILLADAQYQEYLKGRISHTAFMNKLALVWAGLPQSSGKSAYCGYAGNRATISWAEYSREMARIFPS